jgi:hypothetical protein
LQGEGQEFESPRLHHNNLGETTAPNEFRPGEYRVDPASDSQEATAVS